MGAGRGTNKRKSADNPTATGKYPKSSASTHIPKGEVSELVDDNSVVTEGPGVDENSVVTEGPGVDDDSIGTEVLDVPVFMDKSKYFERGIYFGVDGSRIQNGDFVYIIPKTYPALTRHPPFGIQQIGYFHGFFTYNDALIIIVNVIVVNVIVITRN